MWIGKFALLGSGETEWIDLGASAVSTVTGAAYLNGAAYDPEFDALLATTEAVDPSDAFIGGFRYRADGALRVVNADAGVPAGANTNQGLALSEDGQLCYVTLADTAYSLNGVAVDGVRRVYAAPLAFALEFADLGAGVVDTTEAITGATPTFTRATAATTVLSTGLIGAVASGDPRSYYDPTTLEYLGYLAEGARTNLCLQSETLDVDGAGAPWTHTRASVSANAVASPDGATTADKIVEDSSAATTHLIQQAFVKAAGAITYSVSLFAKAAGRTWIAIQGNDTSNAATAYFNLGTGVVGSTTANGAYVVVSSSITAYPNGWYRCSFVYTTPATAADNLLLYIAEDNLDVTFSGDGTSGLYAWGVQKEAASFASTYIPTTTAEVARNADVLTYPTTGWLSATAGTLYAQYQTNGAADAAAAKSAFAINDGDGNEEIKLDIATTMTVRFTVLNGGAVQANIAVGSAVSAGTQILHAGAYTANDFSVARDGTLGTPDTSGTVPTVTTAVIGALAAGTGQMYGPISRVAYYAARLSNATLQGLTNG